MLVLRAHNNGNEQSFTWIEPRLITKVVCELVYELQELVNDRMEQVPAVRLRLYSAEMNGKNVSVEFLSILNRLIRSTE